MSMYSVGPFQLSAERRTLTLGGKPVGLGRKVVETLLALVERPGHACSKDELLDRIWPEGFVEEANLAQNVYVLRKAFRVHGGANPIETIPGYGYRLTAPVRLCDVPVANLSKRRIVVAALAGIAAVAASLVLVATTESSRRAMAPRELSSMGARLYQVGRFYWNLRTRDGVRRSLDYFSRVVDTDPLDARGYAALADANVTMGDYCYGTHRPAVYFGRAVEYAKKAIALDPNSAEAHAALGFVALHRMESKTGMAELARALQLDPSYSDAHEWYGIALLRSGQASEGRRQLSIAAGLDPLSVATISWLAFAAYLDRRFSDAIVYSREALELSPNRTDALKIIGKALEAEGDMAGAIDAFKRYGAVSPYYRASAAALLAQSYAISHRMSAARAQLAYARKHTGAVDEADLAAAQALVGEGRLLPDAGPRRERSHPSWAAIEDAEHFGALVQVSRSARQQTTTFNRT